MGLSQFTGRSMVTLRRVNDTTQLNVESSSAFLLCYKGTDYSLSAMAYHLFVYRIVKFSLQFLLFIFYCNLTTQTN